MIALFQYIQNLIDRIVPDERGATAIEYALLAALIAMAVILAVTSLGLGLVPTFNNVADHFNG